MTLWNLSLEAQLRAGLCALLVVLCLAGCGTRSHGRDDAPADAGPSETDAGALVDAGPEAPPPTPPSRPGGVECGANTCRTDEVCCDPACGVCGFEGECGGECG